MLSKAHRHNLEQQVTQFHPRKKKRRERGSPTRNSPAVALLWMGARSSSSAGKGSKWDCTARSLRSACDSIATKDFSQNHPTPVRGRTRRRREKGEEGGQRRPSQIRKWMYKKIYYIAGEWWEGGGRRRRRRWTGTPFPPLWSGPLNCRRRCVVRHILPLSSSSTSSLITCTIFFSFL